MDDAKKSFDVTIVVSGVPHSVAVSTTEKLTKVVKAALEASGDAGRSPDDFELRTEAGRLLNLDESVAEAGLTPGEILFLNPRAGAGG